MHRNHLIFLVLLAALLLAACAPGNAAGGSNPTGVEWKLAQINGQPVLAGSTVTLKLENNQVGGRGGCNSYGGEYRQEGGRLSFGNLFQTEMGCMDPAGVMEQETAYLRTLSQAAGYEITGDQLQIKNAAGETILVFER